MVFCHFQIILLGGLANSVNRWQSFSKHAHNPLNILKKNRKRKSSCFLDPRRIVELQKHLESLCKKKKKGWFCRRLPCRKNWQKLVNTLCLSLYHWNVKILYLFLSWKEITNRAWYLEFMLVGLAVVKCGLKSISNDVERCLSLVRC